MERERGARDIWTRWRDIKGHGLGGTLSNSLPLFFFIFIFSLSSQSSWVSIYPSSCSLSIHRFFYASLSIYKHGTESLYPPKHHCESSIRRNTFIHYFSRQFLFLTVFLLKLCISFFFSLSFPRPRSLLALLMSVSNISGSTAVQKEVHRWQE